MGTNKDEKYLLGSMAFIHQDVMFTAHSSGILVWVLSMGASKVTEGSEKA